jgi:hypothetical protein
LKDNERESARRQVECRVPQGSVLGPLFFLVYVNDKVRVSGELGFVLFAHDTNFFCSKVGGVGPCWGLDKVSG